MSLPHDVARAIGSTCYGEFDFEEDAIGDWLPEAEAALSVISRQVQLALARINEVRVRLGLSLSECDVTLVTNTAALEMRGSLLDAMAQLESLLPAERAAEWEAKWSRQP